jgi:hypothetical protein
MTAVGVRNVPDPIRRRQALADPDYADVFTLLTSRATDRSSEGWARAVLEHTPVGRSAPHLWRALGLRLGPRPSPDHVQGWRIADRGDGWIRVEALSWFMTAQAVVHVEDGRLSLALILRYERAVAALIWPPVSLMHRRAVPVMLRQALRVDGPRADELSPDPVPPRSPGRAPSRNQR